MEEFVIEEEPTIEATFQMDVSSGNHNDLEGRDLPNQHPMDAITGLEVALDGKVNKTDESSKVYGTDSEGNQTTYDVGSFGQVDDVRVGGVSVVTDKIAELGTMAGETANNYSTTAQADLRYATASQGALANTSIQPNDNISELTNNSNYQTATQVSNSIAVETNNRELADNNLQRQIDAIVSSSDVFDIVGTYAELQAYDISTVPVNDIIKVLEDSTHGGAATYYRCIESDNVKSWSYIGSEGASYTKGEADAKFVPQTRTVNGKALSSDISLTANDVGALPSTTTIPTKTSDLDNDSGYITSADLPTNYVTTNTAQDISEKKTFLGEKAILLKQTAATDKLGFTLYDASNGELGALEYRPNTISGGSLLNLNTPQSGTSWLGFRYWSNINIIAPKPANGNYYIPVNVTNGSKTVTSNNAGTLNISTLIPTVNNPTITFTQGGVNKGSFTLNQATGTTIALDSGGSQIDIDNDTITENASNKLQASGVINPQSGNSIKIWQGTESQWTNGEATTWYYWQTQVQAMWSSGGAISTARDWYSMAYGNGTFIAIASPSFRQGSSVVAKSTDDGVTWTEVSTGFSFNIISRNIVYGNGVFLFVGSNGNVIKTDNNGATWTNITIPSYGAGDCTLAYGDGTFVLIGVGSHKTYYSTDDGDSWVAGGDISNTYNTFNSLAYGNGVFTTLVNNGYGTAGCVYSTDNGQTWNDASIPSGSWWGNIVFCSGKFVALASTTEAHAKMCTSSDGYTWSSATTINNMYNSVTRLVSGDNGILFVTCYNGKDSSKPYSSYLSSDGGETWVEKPLTTASPYNYALAYGNNLFLLLGYSDTNGYRFTVSYRNCYTTDAIPTTSSTVYSAPETSSALTITSVGSGSITLSDTFTYNYTQSGNQFTYRTIGDAHPDWLCNVNGVGVKVGNTMIADNTVPVSSVDSSSTNSDSVGAKLFYDTCGDIETLINAL